jgi:hypothetical protein
MPFPNPHRSVPWVESVVFSIAVSARANIPEFSDLCALFFGASNIKRPILDLVRSPDDSPVEVVVTLYSELSAYSNFPLAINPQIFQPIQNSVAYKHQEGHTHN